MRFYFDIKKKNDESEDSGKRREGDDGEREKWCRGASGSGLGYLIVEANDGSLLGGGCALGVAIVNS